MDRKLFIKQIDKFEGFLLNRIIKKREDTCLSDCGGKYRPGAGEKPR